VSRSHLAVEKGDVSGSAIKISYC